MSKELLIIFVKNIVLGKVKTRLAKSIGNIGALNVYKDLFNITQKETLKLKIDRHIYFSDIVIDSAWPNDSKFIQKGSDIGERMKNAFKEGFEKANDDSVNNDLKLKSTGKSVVVKEESKEIEKKKLATKT